MATRSSSEGQRVVDPEKRGSDVEAEAADGPVASKDEAEDDYPDGWRQVAAIMLAVYLAMFIVALVCLSLSRPMEGSLARMCLTWIGSNNTGYCDTQYYRRVSLNRRCRLVRKFVLAHLFRVSTHLWPNIHLLLTEMGPAGCNYFV
jgi:hypothetical protein